MRWMIPMIALGLSVAQLAAQQPRQQTRPGAPGPFRVEFLEGGLPEYLAGNPASLNLTADQLQRIQARAHQLERDNAPLKQQVQAAQQGRDWSALSQEERQALMLSTRTQREQMRANYDAAVAQMRAILNTEQRRALDAQPGWGRGRLMMKPGARPMPMPRGRGPA